MSTTPKNILTILDDTLAELQKVIDHHVSMNREISLGTNTAKFSSRCATIRQNLSDANRLLSCYCQLFAGKTLSIETFKEILSLPLSNSAQLDKELRIRYLQHHEIPLPNFRIDVLALGYNFQLQDLLIIDDIKESADKYSKTKIGLDTTRYFSSRGLKFEFTKENEEEIRNQFTKKATEKDLLGIIGHWMIICGMNSLRGQVQTGILRTGNDNPIRAIGYSLEKDSYYLKWEELVGPLYEQHDAISDIKVIPVMDHEPLKVSINGRMYKFRSPSASVLGGSKVIFKEALVENPELFYQITSDLFKKKSGILVDLGPVEALAANEENF